MWNVLARYRVFNMRYVPTKLYRPTTRYLVCGRPVFGVNLLSTTGQLQGRIFLNPDKEWHTRSVNLLFKYKSAYLVYERYFYSLKKSFLASCTVFRKIYIITIIFIKFQSLFFFIYISFFYEIHFLATLYLKNNT
jgi:hypothetical protein